MGPDDLGFGFDAFGAFGVVFVVLLVLGLLFIAAVITFMVIAITRNVRKAKELGHDPLTMETELTARAIDSKLLAPEVSTEARLAELDDLHARGVITATEYATARAEVISSL
ncbi:SHOCT domain-containing protein [Protaetiibacter larvae]|nr:SHOCT domain-containing protein [Protaetiibacter larvae]